MSGQMKLASLIGLLMLAHLAFGCAPPKKTVMVVPPPEIDRKAAPVTGLKEDVQTKAAALERLLREESMSEPDREAISGLASAYRALTDMAARGCANPDFSKSLTALVSALNRVESKAVSRGTPQAPDPASVMNLHAVKEREILEAFAAGDHRKVITQCEDLKAHFGPDGFTPDLGVAFAVSLAQAGRLREAILVAETILRDLEPRPGAVTFGADLTQWHLMAGEKERAVRAYQRIVDIHEEQGSLLQSLGEKIAVNAEVASGPQIPIARPARPEKPREDVRWLPLDQLLQKIEFLKGEKRFDEARSLLLMRQEEAMPGPELDAIQDALKVLEEAERAHLEERLASVSKKAQGLKDARRLIDEERYEEALSALETLESVADDGGGPDVRELKEKALEGVIDRERNRAARLFLAARQATDRAKKEEYLRASYEVLQSLVDKYPTSPLINKVRAHRDRVREELEKR